MFVLLIEDCEQKREGGGRARADNTANANTAPGLVTTRKAALQLEPH